MSNVKTVLAYESYDFNTGSAADFFSILENLIVEAADLSDNEIICEILPDFFSYQWVDQICNLFLGIL